MKYYRTYNMMVGVFVVIFAGVMGTIWHFSRPLPVAVASDVVCAPAAVPASPAPDAVPAIESAIDTLLYRDIDSPAAAEPVGPDEPASLYTAADDLVVDSFAETGGRIPAATSAAASPSTVAAIEPIVVVSGSGSDSGSSSLSASSGSTASGTSSGSTDASSANDTSTPTGQSASPVTGGGTPAFPNASVTILSSVQRLLQDDISAPGSNEAELFCAKNETEAFQVIVTNESYYSLRDVEIRVSDWQGPDGPKPKLTLFREHYVHVKQSSYGLDSETGWYPDALIPFIDPYTGRKIRKGKYRADHVTVNSRRSQGYWADVRVDADVSAGTYTCSMLVTSLNRPVAEIPVTLTVWDFTLPQHPVWTAFFSKLRNDLNKAYGLARDQAAWEEILLRHEDFLYEHGIYPSFHKHPRINYNTGDVVFTSDYINSLRVFVKKYGPRIIRVSTQFSDEPQKLKKYVMAYDAFSRSNPWAGQYVYYLDEPGATDSFRVIEQCGDIIHEYAPSIKLAVAMDRPPPVSMPEVKDVIDIYIQVFRLAGKATIQNLYRPGKTIWAYTALVHEGLNWQLDSNLIDYRIPAWCSYSLGIEGIYYWQTTVWAGSPGAEQQPFDPWLTQESYRSKRGPEYVWNGEGSLFYPGMPAGIDGPVSSMRLKVFRDSVEDYAYFKLLEAKAGRSQALLQMSAVVTDFLTYDKSPKAYMAQRRAIAELILK